LEVVGIMLFGIFALVFSLGVPIANMILALIAFSKLKEIRSRINVLETAIDAQSLDQAE
jgi:hypothetical protein